MSYFNSSISTRIWTRICHHDSFFFFSTLISYRKYLRALNHWREELSRSFATSVDKEWNKVHRSLCMSKFNFSECMNDILPMNPSASVKVHTGRRAKNVIFVSMISAYKWLCLPSWWRSKWWGLLQVNVLLGLWNRLFQKFRSSCVKGQMKMNQLVGQCKEDWLHPLPTKRQ